MVRVIIDPGVLQKLTVEGATILLDEIGVTVPQIAHLTLMVPEISDQQLQGQVNQQLQGQDQKKEQKGRPFRSGSRVELKVPQSWWSHASCYVLNTSKITLVISFVQLNSNLPIWLAY